MKNSHLPKRQSSNSLSEHIRHSVAKPQPTFLATFLIQLLISFYPLIHLLFSTSNYTKLHDLQFLINARIFHAALLFHTLLLLPEVLFPSLFAQQTNTYLSFKIQLCVIFSMKSFQIPPCYTAVELSLPFMVYISCHIQHKVHYLVYKSALALSLHPKPLPTTVLIVPRSGDVP